MGKEMQCIKLVIFSASDCGSNYMKAMEIHSKNIANGNIDNDLQHMRAMPDIVHVVKCLSCSLTNWFLVVEGNQINTSFLGIIRETEPLGTQMRRVLPLEAVKQCDRMRSQTPRQISL